MGLGSKLGQCNTVADENLKHATNPVSDAGYNHNNIPTLPTMPAMTPTEISGVNQIAAKAQYEYQDKQVNNFNLLKPTVPQGTQYPDATISALVVEKMWRIVCIKELHAFYSQQSLQALVDRACKHDWRLLMIEWYIPTIDMVTDIAVLGLYDIVVNADDSGSMKSPDEDNMTRFEVLKIALKTIGCWSTMMDADGIVLRFFNSKEEGNGLSTLADVEKCFDGVHPSGLTPMGEGLNRIFETIVSPLMFKGALERPVLVITIKDGAPQNEQLVVDTIIKCRNMCSQSKYGQNAMAFGFSQIGKDKGAEDFLNMLDIHPLVGHLVDCTSEFSMEQKQCGPAFTPAVWIVKTMIGPIDPAYDQADEGVNNTSTVTTATAVQVPPNVFQSVPVATAYATTTTGPPPQYGNGPPPQYGNGPPPPYY